jgi:hypothetical protein
MPPAVASTLKDFPMPAHRLRYLLPLLATLLLGACSEPPAPASFVNRVWSVSESPTVSKGMLYVFLSDGTLVLASSGNKPAFGQWQQDGADLVMIEEGQRYKTEVLMATKDILQLRQHNPGEPVEMTLVPAN